MRFVLTIALFVMLAPNGLAAPWDVVPLKEAGTTVSHAPQRSIQMQRGGSSNKLETIKGLELSIAATGLGEISAMALNANGALHTADRKSGRIWRLPDRGKDGVIDIRRPLSFKFDAPSGLTAIGDSLYVADRNAVWVIAPGQEPKQLASLTHANSAGGPHVLLAGHDGETLILGLTTITRGVRLLEINKQSGEARLIGEGQYGTLHSLAQRGTSDIWIGSDETLSALGASPLPLKTGQSISALALPGQYETPPDWPPQLKDHIIASQIGRGAMQLIAIPSEFGHVSSAPRVLVEGFLTASGRSAWGRPGPIVIDKRGLFFADSHNGTIWRLSAAPKPQAKITIIDTASLPPNPNDEPKLDPQDKAFTISSSIQGTQIDTNNTIVQPSSISYGSKLIKDFDEKKALEEAQNNKAKPKKKRRMSRKRKQPN